MVSVLVLNLVPCVGPGSSATLYLSAGPGQKLSPHPHTSTGLCHGYTLPCDGLGHGSSPGLVPGSGTGGSRSGSLCVPYGAPYIPPENSSSRSVSRAGRGKALFPPPPSC